MKQGWEIKNIGSIADITDYVANGSFATLRENVSYLNEEGYAILVRLADYTNGFDSSKFVYIDEHAYNFLAKSKLYGGEIIMSNVGSIGKCFKCPDLNKPMSLAPNSIVIRTPNNDFYHYVFQSFYFQSEVKRISSQTALPKFNKTSFKNINVPIPPREEQERIVAELDCLSGVIEKKREQLRELDALAQSIFYQMFGDPITNEKGWDVKKWKDMLTIVNGKNQKTVENPDGAYPIYGSGGIMGYADKYLCPKNTVIIGRKGNINKPIFVKEPFWNVDTAFGLIADNIHIAPTYLFFYCGIFNFEQLNKAVTIPSLTKSDLLELNTPCPPIALQQEFAEKIEKIEQQKKLISQSIKEVEDLFNSRMQYYFN